VRRFLGGLVDKLRARATARRAREVRRAVAERERGEPHDGTIWRSGKGGSHIG
jgi:hypothetical protein